jgi:hypothetical protein
MPSSSTNYSYEIPTVGSDSTTYGTIINQFVESLSAKLKTVSDKINAAGVGASSTLAQVNRNIAQVDAINSRLPVGVSDLLPDPYSGATTPVSTWPYLNTELQAEGFSPPTTAQEVLDFDYSGFATYLNTRFDSLSARIVGLDAPITIADSSKLICETNAILDAIGTYKTVTTTETTSEMSAELIVETTLIEASKKFFVGTASYGTYVSVNSARTAINRDLETVLSAWGGSVTQSSGGYSTGATIRNINSDLAAGTLGTGNYIHKTTGQVDNISNEVTFNRFFGRAFNDIQNVLYIFIPGDRKLLFDAEDNGARYGSLKFYKITRTTTTGTVNTQVKVTINDVDFSGCS